MLFPLWAERYALTDFLIKVCRGIVKGNVAVFTNADKANVDGSAAKLFGKCFDALNGAVNKMSGFEGAHFCHKTLF